MKEPLTPKKTIAFKQDIVITNVSKRDTEWFAKSDNFERRFQENSFISFQFARKTLKDKKIIITYEDKDIKEEFENSFRQNGLIFFSGNEIFIFQNYNLKKVFYKNRDSKITIRTEFGLELEVDYIKDFAERLTPNIFSITEALLMQVNKNIPDISLSNDYIFIKYILDYKKETIHEYVKLDKPELLDALDIIKGSYRDLTLIEKANILDNVMFQDSNLSYTNFLNFFFNVIPENYENIINTFERNRFLYEKFKADFVVTTNEQKFVTVNDFEDIKIGKAYHFKTGNVEHKGMYFVNDMVDDKYIIRTNIMFLKNIVSRRFEILADVKKYVGKLKSVRDIDFQERTLNIDNNAKSFITNNLSFRIPGQPIDFNTLALDTSLKECYLDYLIRVDMDTPEFEKFSLNFEAFKKTLDERMPFFLQKYMKMFEIVTTETIDSGNIKEQMEFDLDVEELEFFEHYISEQITIDGEIETLDTYEDFIDEELSIQIEWKTDFNGIKIGSGILLDKMNLVSSGFLGKDKIYVYGSNDYDVEDFYNIKIGRVPMTLNNKKYIEPLMTKRNPWSEKSSSKNLVQCRSYDVQEKYQNKLFQMTEKYFRYVENTEFLKKEDVQEFLDISDEPSGIYCYQGDWKVVENMYETEWKVGKDGLYINGEKVALDIKEQFFGGKPRDKYVVRDYYIK